MIPYRAPSLTRLVRDVDTRWPMRGHALDGWIGDAAHQKRVSDHNPDPSSHPPGVVRAEDLDLHGIHIPTVIAGIMCHPSTRYVIYRETIWTVENEFRPHHYTGTPHNNHIHDSIKHGAENMGGIAFPLIGVNPAWGVGISLHRKTGAPVRECQAYLNAYGAALVLDGDAGPATVAAIRGFQARHHLKVDGIAGPKTLAAMRTA